MFKVICRCSNAEYTGITEDGSFATNQLKDSPVAASASIDSMGRVKCAADAGISVC